jgi:hypothetical protein
MSMGEANFRPAHGPGVYIIGNFPLARTVPRAYASGPLQGRPLAYARGTVPIRRSNE